MHTLKRDNTVQKTNKKFRRENFNILYRCSNTGGKKVFRGSTPPITPHISNDDTQSH